MTLHSNLAGAFVFCSLLTFGQNNSNGSDYSGGYYGVEKDRAKALELFRAAAVAHYGGITVAKDDPTALQWAVKPAQAGRSQDHVFMARLLQNGVGVPHAMRKAAANGQEEAKAEIANGFSGN